MGATTKIPFKLIADINEPANFPIAKIDQSTKSLRCQVWWEGVDRFDGKLKFMVREDHRAPWAPIERMIQPIDNYDEKGGGQITFIYDPCSGDECALYIDPGSAKIGKINLILIENEG